jgi:hypothetical protein
MPKYSIKDPQTGKTVTVSGAKPPTQEQADNIFKAAGLRSTSSPETVTNKIVNTASNVGKFLLPRYYGVSKNS